MKLSSKELLDYIKANPKATNLQIANQFKMDAGSVSARTGKLFAQGRVDRSVVARTASGIGVFGYTFLNDDTVRERKITRDNVRVEPVVNAVRPALPAPKEPEKESKPTINQSLNLLAEAMAEAIVGQIRSKLALELTTMMPTPALNLPSASDLIARITKPAALPAPTKTKALIVGVTPQQMGVLTAEFSDAFDLTIWNDRFGGSYGQLKSDCVAADVVFVHTPHMSHSAHETVMMSKTPFVRVGGGLTAMKDALLKYYVEGVTA